MIPPLLSMNRYGHGLSAAKRIGRRLEEERSVERTHNEQRADVTRNWLGYVCEAIITSGAMPAWEAVAYLAEHLIGEAPNRHLLETKAPYEATSQFLNRLYNPLVEAASRDVSLPSSAMLHTFTDISLTGNSAVLVVYFPGHNLPHQLLLLDAVRAWDLMFPDEDCFNRWAEERYRWIKTALATAIAKTRLSPLAVQELTA